MFATKKVIGHQPRETEGKRLTTLQQATLIVAVTAILVAAMSLCSSMTGMFNRAPAIVLWAWEREEDLNFLTPRSATVAYYAGTLYLRGDRVFLRPRLQKLFLPEGTQAYPVFRIENRLTAAAPSLSSVPEVVEAIIRQFHDHPAPCIQIDYDATESERAFYIELLHKLRKALPPRTRISITALASWCLDDRWLDRADADEAVAMLFSMGRGSDDVLALLKNRKLNTASKMDLAIGISANERQTNFKLKQLGVLGGCHTLYLFDSLRWTRSRFDRIKHEVLDK